MTILEVPTMHCGHRVRSIENAPKADTPEARVAVDPDARQVRVERGPPPARLVELPDAAGHPATGIAPDAS